MSTLLVRSVTLHQILVGLVLFVVTFIVSLAVVSFILVKIPATYFQTDHPRDLWTNSSPAVRYLGIAAKNILGALLVALGIVMSIPGVPGQGILTILLGVMLLDFPGKRRVEINLVSRPKVLKTINKLRQRFGKPSLVLD
ncbi:MAG: hypothetical protein ABR501_07265 [Pyrinomonadaceae bacterium]